MKDDKFEISPFPDTEWAQGFYGSLMQQSGPVYDDSIVEIMVYLYDVLPPEALG